MPADNTTSATSASISAGERPIHLLFHSVHSNPFLGLSNLSPARFRAILYAIVAFKKECGREIVMTFDDGYDHLRELLAELATVHSFPVLLFVPTAYVGKFNEWDFAPHVRRLQHLDKNGLRDLARVGVTIGSHGHEHTDLTRLDPAKQMDELATSRKILEEVTGRPCHIISYPFGSIAPQVLEAARSAGFTRGFTTRRPDPADHPLATGRIAIQSIDSPMTVTMKLRQDWAGRGLTRLSEQLSRGSIGTVILQSIRTRWQRTSR